MRRVRVGRVRPSIMCAVMTAMLAVAFGDELVAVAVGEVPRAVARRQAGAQAEDLGDRHGAHDERRPVRASTT